MRLLLTSVRQNLWCRRVPDRTSAESELWGSGSDGVGVLSTKCGERWMLSLWNWWSATCKISWLAINSWGNYYRYERWHQSFNHLCKFHNTLVEIIIAVAKMIGQPRVVLFRRMLPKSISYRTGSEAIAGRGISAILASARSAEWRRNCLGQIYAALRLQKAIDLDYGFRNENIEMERSSRCVWQSLEK